MSRRRIRDRIPPSVKRALGWLENVVLAVVVLWALSRVGPQLAAAVGLELGVRESPEIEVATLDGGRFSLADHRGRVVLVNFWATWCRPCVIEMPGFQKAYERYREEGFAVLGLSTDAAELDEVERFVRERGVTYPVAMATPALRNEFGGIREIPTSFLVDRSGRIRYTVRGLWAGPALRAAVRRLLTEDGG